METDLTGFSGDTFFLAGFAYQGAIIVCRREQREIPGGKIRAIRYATAFVSKNLPLQHLAGYEIIEVLPTCPPFCKLFKLGPVIHI